MATDITVSRPQLTSQVKKIVMNIYNYFQNQNQTYNYFQNQDERESETDVEIKAATATGSSIRSLYRTKQQSRGGHYTVPTLQNKDITSDGSSG